MKRFSLLTFTVLLFAGVVLASTQVQLDYFKVERDPASSNAYVVKWQMVQEEGVRGYEVLRKSAMQPNEAVPVTNDLVTPHGVRSEYVLRDDQLFKSAVEQVEYRLNAVLTDGRRQELGAQKVDYFPTAIRRTWGSIKAMFQ